MYYGVDMKNILFTNVGRRAKLLQNFKSSIGNEANIIATDNWSVAPALFFADKYYLTKKIVSPEYIDEVFEICDKENINAITTLIDPEIMLLAKYNDTFVKQGILPLLPSEKTAKLCFDKYEMFNHLKSNKIPTILTYKSLEDFELGYKNHEIDFPVFVKPRTGSGSVGARKVNTYEELKKIFEFNSTNIIIQEFFEGKDIDVDVYVDTISKKTISMFAKKKIETRIGGTSKSYSFKDSKLFDFVHFVLDHFEFSGPTDIEVFEKNGKYILSEINPRFSGAYLHAYGAGVDFPKMILNNINGIENNFQIGNYDEDVIMLMYDDVVITKLENLKGDYND